MSIEVEFKDGSRREYEALPERPIAAQVVRYHDEEIEIELRRSSVQGWTPAVWFRGKLVKDGGRVSGWWRVRGYVRDRGIGWSAKIDGDMPWWKAAGLASYTSAGGR